MHVRAQHDDDDGDGCMHVYRKMMMMVIGRFTCVQDDDDDGDDGYMHVYSMTMMMMVVIGVCMCTG